jgi:hypothetical protein
MTVNEMLQELGNIDGHGDPCEAHSLVRLNSFEANAIAAKLALPKLGKSGEGSKENQQQLEVGSETFHLVVR